MARSAAGPEPSTSVVCFKTYKSVLDKIDERAAIRGVSRSRYVHQVLNEIIAKSDALDQIPEVVSTHLRLLEKNTGRKPTEIVSMILTDWIARGHVEQKLFGKVLSNPFSVPFGKDEELSDFHELYFVLANQYKNKILEAAEDDKE